MKTPKKIAALILCGAMSVSLLAACASNTGATATTQAATQATEVTDSVEEPESTNLVIAEQGIFSAGGITVTSDGTFDPENQWEDTGAGQTAHVDHANVLYQIPADETGLPMATASPGWAG